MRQALRIGGGVLAVGLVAYAVIALSGDSGSSSKAPERKRARAAAASDSDGGDDESNKRAAKKVTSTRDAKKNADRKALALPSGTATATTTPKDVRYEDAHDELVALVEEVEGMAARGEHLTQARFVEIYRKGDILSVAIMRTPEVAASDDVRSQVSKLNQRFRMKMTEVAPVPNAE